MSITAAVAGASQVKRNGGNAATGAAATAKSRRSSLAEGRRGVHQSNCFSNSFNSFISFIRWSFQE